MSFVVGWQKKVRRKKERKKRRENGTKVARWQNFRDQPKGPLADRLASLSAETIAAEAFLFLFRLISTKFNPFLSLDCSGVEGVGAQSKERKGLNFAAHRRGAIVLQARRAKYLHSEISTFWKFGYCHLATMEERKKERKKETKGEWYEGKGILLSGWLQAYLMSS